MYFVYILSFYKAGKYYTGLTRNLFKRLNEHKRKESKISKDLGEFKILFAAIFPTQDKAARFEQYLKSGSGRKFRNKHLV